MILLKKGDYLAPETEVVEMKINASLLTISGGNESFGMSGNSYGNDDFDD